MSVGTNVMEAPNENNVRVDPETTESQPCPVDDALSDSNKTIETIRSQRNETPPPSEQTSGTDPTKGYLPEMLNSDQINFDEVRKRLEHIVVQKIAETAHENRFTNKEDALRPLDALNNAIVSSHALAAYASTLDISTLKRLTAHIVADTGFWMSRTFRFQDGCIFCHDDAKEGLIRTIRMLLFSKYEKYQVDAYQASLQRPPCIYVSGSLDKEGKTNRPSIAESVCTSLGIPRGCIRTMPPNSKIAMLKGQIEEDISKNRVPLIVMMSIGSLHYGQIDELRAVYNLCQERKIWLHLDGYALFSLVIAANVAKAQCADSMTLSFGSCLGVPSLPYVTLYRPIDPALAYSAGLTLFNIHSKLHCLPLWTTLQCLGRSGIRNRILHRLELSEKLFRTLQSNRDCIGVFGRKLETVGMAENFEKYLSETTDVFDLFDHVSPMVTFRFKGVEKDDASRITKRFSETYMNNLNLWLVQMVHREVPTVPLELVEVDGQGIFLNFSPFDCVHDISGPQMEIFCQNIEGHLGILSATIGQKNKFYDLLDGKHEAFGKNLRVVEIEGWAGLGGIRYIPTDYVSKEGNFSEDDTLFINNINTSLVSKLRDSDSAFSLGIGTDGMHCVGFGMVTDDLNVEELIYMVLSCGTELEENSKQLEQMSALVRQAVEQANAALLRETEEKIYQDGILKHVPIVGSLFQWLAPSADDGPGVKGRSFNISSGMVETTENTYKYHMQMKDESSTRTPPPAQQFQVQGTPRTRNPSTGTQAATD